MSTPEMATIARFIERLTGSPDTPMRWYCLIGGIEPRDGTVVEVKDGIIKKQAEGTDVFVVVNEPGSVRALHIGGDGKPPERWHQEPDFIVMTDAAWQAYWLVSDCPADEFRKYQGRLTDYYGVEPFGCATWWTHAPGTLHFSDPDNPRLVQLVEVREAWEGVRTIDVLTADLPPVGLNRRGEWPKRFEQSMKGNFYCKIPLALGGGNDVVVFRRKDSSDWGVVANGVFSERTYSKPEDAMLATFDYLRGQWERSHALKAA